MLPFELTKDTPYLALSGELWSVFCEYFNRNWPCYKGFLLYIYSAFWKPNFRRQLAYKLDTMDTSFVVLCTEMYTSINK